MATRSCSRVHVANLPPSLRKRLATKPDMAYIQTMPANAQRFYDRVEDDALHLSLEDRTSLIERLQASLKEETSLSSQWVTEIDKRADGIDSGRVQLLDGDECMRRFNAI